MLLPRSLFSRLSPMMKRVAITAGVNGPNFETLAMVHLACEGSGQACTAIPEKAARVVMGAEVMNAGMIGGEVPEWRMEIEISLVVESHRNRGCWMRTIYIACW